MERVFHFTGNKEADWTALLPLWQQSDCVMSAEVGPAWRMPPEHRVCMEFADQYPDSKIFLIARLSDPDPRLVAYAFKILIRICELQSADMPPQVMARTEEITVLHHSREERQTLQEFFAGYFESCAHEEVMESDERSINWQDNELTEYDRASQMERSEPGS